MVIFTSLFSPASPDFEPIVNRESHFCRLGSATLVQVRPSPVTSLAFTVVGWLGFCDFHVHSRESRESRFVLRALKC